MPLACVFRLGQFMARAKRVVGASGSTTAGGGPLPGREQAPVPSFFEMPWSQDPKLFETRIVPDGFTSPSKLSDGSPAQLAGGSGIWCHRREIIPCALNQDETLLVTSDQVERYCQAIRADISSIQAPRTDESGAAVPVRPVLVFVPELLAYVDGKGRRRAVRDRLSEVILELVGNDFRVDMPRGEDPTETEIQRIGQPGFVTLAGIMLGRGIDIRVSVSIPGGLHVLVGAEVVHERLLKQMIGRTGRLGREGSYSIISLGRILSPSKPVSSAPYSAPRVGAGSARPPWAAPTDGRRTARLGLQVAALLHALLCRLGARCSLHQRWELKGAHSGIGDEQFAWRNRCSRKAPGHARGW